MIYCTKCLTPESRPRVRFNDKGVCNACLHAEAKRSMNWSIHWSRLEELCGRYRSKDTWDVLVPCSGGKDGSYVAWMLRERLGMHPLCVTVMPQMPTAIGKQNLDAFRASGFDHILVSPDPEVYRRLAVRGFVERGQPKEPFIAAIWTVTTQIALRYGIKLIIMGEEGESEYGGGEPPALNVSRDYIVRVYYSGVDPYSFAISSGLTPYEAQWWRLPTQQELDRLMVTHWSRWEDWDPLKHKIIAITQCGMSVLPDPSVGTFTNYAQLDDDLQDLHAYLMFLKFGFGRATSDANIEIRAGRMDRFDGRGHVEAWDGEVDLDLLEAWQRYMGQSSSVFWSTLARHADPRYVVPSGERKRPRCKPWVLAGRIP